jgi:UPF0755 protein
MQKLKPLFLSLLFCAALSASGLIWLRAAFTSPGPLPEHKLVYIEPGSAVASIAHTLQDEGAIDKTWALSLAARMQRGNGPLKAGEYDIPAGSSVNDIVAILQAGKTFQRRVTFAEGLTSAEIVELLNSAEAMEGTITDIPPEGSLLPDTYAYSRGDTRADMVARIQKSMRDALDELWNNRAPDLPFASREEAVTLASIVEKETGVAPERPRVAGVFVNRMRLGMPLQSDPTVIYAVTHGKQKLDRSLNRKDLTANSAYNTYKVPGLPPGPIANPGRAEVLAFMNELGIGYLFLVCLVYC